MNAQAEAARKMKVRGPLHCYELPMPMPRADAIPGSTACAILRRNVSGIRPGREIEQNSRGEKELEIVNSKYLFDHEIAFTKTRIPSL